MKMVAREYPLKVRSWNKNFCANRDDAEVCHESVVVTVVERLIYGYSSYSNSM